MTPPLTNPLFAGVPKVLWDSFSKHCTFRWKESLNEKTYPTEYKYQGQNYPIPYRIGYQSNEGWTAQNETHEAMGLCLQSRHHNGFVREKALLQLFSYTQYPFVLAYITRLAGSYVYALYQHINEARDSFDKDAIQQFCAENETFLEQTWARMTSYWNCYYRATHPDRLKMPNAQFLLWLQTFQ